MKRPGPLPSPPPRNNRDSGRKGSAASPERDSASGRARAAGGAPKPREGAASVLPFDRGGDAHERPDGVARAGGPEDDERVGWRDVWRASRARRKALRAEVRRFTARSRRRRLMWTISLAAVVLLVAGSFGVAYSPLFAVREIHVVGAETLDTAEVEDALSDQIGTPLPAVDHSAVKAALVGFPLIETYTLEARPPHDVVVRIVERTPVGVIGSDAGYTVVDAAGVALSSTPEPPQGQPVIDAPGGTDSDVFEAIAKVLRALPEQLRSQVAEITATTLDDVTITLADTGTTVVWGSAEESALKAAVLERAMVARPPDTITGYDISSPNAIVVN